MGVERDELIEDTLITLSHVQEHLCELMETLEEGCGEMNDTRYRRLDREEDFAEYLLEGIYDAQCMFEHYRAYGSQGGELENECQKIICELQETLSDAYANIDYLCNMHKEKSKKKSYGKNAQKSRK